MIVLLVALVVLALLILTLSCHQSYHDELQPVHVPLGASQQLVPPRGVREDDEGVLSAVLVYARPDVRAGRLVLQVAAGQEPVGPGEEPRQRGGAARPELLEVEDIPAIPGHREVVQEGLVLLAGPLEDARGLRQGLEVLADAPLLDVDGPGLPLGGTTRRLIRQIRIST